MKRIVPFLIAVASIALALYVGGYLMFIGGITELVDAIQESPVRGGSVAWGVARVIFASLVGFAILGAGLFGAAFVNDEVNRSARLKRRDRLARNRRGVV